MFKYILILGLVVIASAHKHRAPICQDYLQDECEERVNCQWNYQENHTGCSDAVYVNLGSRRNLEQEAVFSREAICSSNLKHGDFIARRTFREKRFSNWCNWLNILQIKIKDVFYTEAQNLGPDGHADCAIIYPQVPEGTAYLFTRRYFRGDSWVINTNTKLNGQVVRSIMIGDKTRLSLYDEDGEGLRDYQGVKYDDVALYNIVNDVDGNEVARYFLGIENVHGAEKVEYVLLESYFGTDDPNQ